MVVYNFAVLWVYLTALNCILNREKSMNRFEHCCFAATTDFYILRFHCSAHQQALFFIKPFTSWRLLMQRILKWKTWSPSLHMCHCGCAGFFLGLWTYCLWSAVPSKNRLSNQDLLFFPGPSLSSFVKPRVQVLIQQTVTTGFNWETQNTLWIFMVLANLR